MFAQRIKNVHIVIYAWCCIHSGIVHGLRLYADAELGSGDFGSDELMQRQGNDLLRTSINDTQQTPADQRASLQTDINDFIDLIPADEVAAKMAEYYRSDVGVHHVFNYVNGEEFRRLGRHVLESNEFRELNEFMIDLGFDVQAICRRINHLLGFTKLIEGAQLQRTSPNGTTQAPLPKTLDNGLLNELLTMLPQDGIFIMFFDKLDSSLAFSNMVQQISSPVFLAKFDALRNSNVLREAVVGLTQHDVNVSKILDMLSSYFLFGTF